MSHNEYSAGEIVRALFDELEPLRALHGYPRDRAMDDAERIVVAILEDAYELIPPQRDAVVGIANEA